MVKLTSTFGHIFREMGSLLTTQIFSQLNYLLLCVEFLSQKSRCCRSRIIHIQHTPHMGPSHSGQHLQPIPHQTLSAEEWCYIKIINSGTAWIHKTIEPSLISCQISRETSYWPNLKLVLGRIFCKNKI